MSELQILQRHLNDIFKNGGILSGKFNGYQERKEQVNLSNLVVKSLLEKKHGLLEAGTGTGKSLAYGIAASLYALISQETVIISTNTITLQNQLVYKDFPLIREVLRDLLGETINFSLAKGRNNYLCKRRLNNYLENALTKELPNVDVANEIASSISKSRIGDREDISVEIPNDLWMEIRGESDDCLGQDSPFYKGCFIQQAKQNIRAANVVICNHALFFTDLNLKEKGMEGILPEYSSVIFDEGHRIEEVFSNFYQKNITSKIVNNLFERVIKQKSHWMQSNHEFETPITKEIIAEVEEYQKKIMHETNKILQAIGIEMHRGKLNHLLLKKAIIQENYNLNTHFNSYLNFFKNIKASMDWDDKVEGGLKSYIDSIEEIRSSFDHLLKNKSSEQWATSIRYRHKFDDEKETKGKKEVDIKSISGKVSLVGEPIEAHTVLKDSLFKHKTVIVTSATLTTGGKFSFIADRLGVGKNYISSNINSPFDYKKNSILVVPDRVPQPNHNQYEKYIIDSCKKVLSITEGKTLILFTSYKHLSSAALELDAWCKERGISLLEHKPGINREQLISDFKEEEKAVILGAESFWEGVDIPGNDLKCVMIVKIPFPVPTDPIIEARSLNVEKQGKNPFMDYLLPIALLKITQGFGRLIRTVNDSGAVIILDSRIHTKRYGKEVIRSLPDTNISKSIDDIRPFVV